METQTSETLGWMKDISRGRECATESYLYQGQGKVKLTDVQEVGISGYPGWGVTGRGHRKRPMSLLGSGLHVCTYT